MRGARPKDNTCRLGRLRPAPGVDLAGLHAPRSDQRGLSLEPRSTDRPNWPAQPFLPPFSCRPISARQAGERSAMFFRKQAWTSSPSGGRSPQYVA